MRGLAVQRVLVKKLGGKCAYDGSMRAFSFSVPGFVLTSLELFLFYTVAYLFYVVKHIFISLKYFSLDFYSVLCYSLSERW